MNKLMFKKGDKLICVDANDCCNLTLNKIYELMEDESQTYKDNFVVKIKNDKGVMSGYYSSRFQLVNETEWKSNAQQCLNKLKNELLGEDWYIVDPVGGNQANEIITERIIKLYKLKGLSLKDFLFLNM